MQLARVKEPRQVGQFSRLSSKESFFVDAFSLVEEAESERDTE